MYSRVRDLRKDSRLTQGQVAVWLHVSRQAYTSYENGVNAIPPELLCAIAESYSTSVDYLLGRTDERKPCPKG